ncbi:peptidoglycan editing factor PgeF [Salinicoccus sp. Marseille-QA3877]
MSQFSFQPHRHFYGNKEGDCLFGYTKRTDGLSDYPKDSFNMALYIGDDTDNVNRHQDMLASEIDISPLNWVLPIQTHGSRVKEVTSNDRGTNVRELTAGLNDIDAIYTYDENVLLTMNYADCVPVYVYSRINSFTALVHAGWKGTSKDILKNTLNEYDGHPCDLTVIIGISINQSHYEVDEKVIDALDDRYLKDAVVETDSGYQLDLKTVNKNQALDFGVDENDIHVTPLGTEDTDEFFSYRLEKGKTGRALAFIGRVSND